MTTPSATDELPALSRFRASMDIVHWRYWQLSFLLLVALAVRLALFNGVFGSDDTVYLTRSVEVTHGIWSSADYNGALRYGFNIPAGMLMYLFGVNEYTANLWPLLCSLGEIAAVYLLASYVWSSEAALYSALILISMPIHIAVATRIHADSVVSLFVTLSFVLFYIAERFRNPALYFAAGISMGLVFWTKELALVTLVPFFLYPILARKTDVRWLFVIAGGLTMLILHLALMAAISGDPFHLFKVILGALYQPAAPNQPVLPTQPPLTSGEGESPWFYFQYLFFNIKHTWLAPFLAAPAAVLIVRRCRLGSGLNEGTCFIVFWAISLIAVLSFLPISFAPLRFPTKQSNYLTLFIAPIALLAGYQLTRLPRPIRLMAICVVLSGGLALGALEQADYRVFTSNSKAASSFADARAGALVIGSTNNANIGASYAILRGATGSRIMSLKQASAADTSDSSNRERTGGTYIILDQETIDWAAGAVKLNAPLPCWREYSRLAPVGFGISKPIIESGIGIMKSLPAAIASRLVPPFERLIEPKPAIVYTVERTDAWCGRKTDF